MFLERTKTSQQEEGWPGYFLSAVCMFFHRPIDAFVGKETWQTIIDWRCEWLRASDLASQLQAPETGQISGQTHFEEVIFTTFGVKSVIWSVSEVSCARGQWAWGRPRQRSSLLLIWTVLDQTQIPFSQLRLLQQLSRLQLQRLWFHLW